MSQGFFFSEDDTESMEIKDSLGSDCTGCKMYVGCQHPRMGVTGKGKRNVLIIGEASGKTEDEQGCQFVGETGEFLRESLFANHLDLEEDFFKINAVGCWPRNEKGSNRTPTDKEISFCRPAVMRAIEETNPKFIWLLGRSAMKSVLKGRVPGDNLTMDKMRGACIPDQKLKRWILPIHHPSYLIRLGKDPVANSVYQRDIAKAVNNLNLGEVPDHSVANRIFTLFKYDEVISLLANLVTNPPKELVFDYETTGLKPYGKSNNHKIASISLCKSADMAYSFPLQYEGHWSSKELQEIIRLWVLLMENPTIKKINQNLKFEAVWTKVILNATMQNFHYCTMIGCHIMDNRKNYTNLKLQAYLNFGIPDYSKELDRYLRNDIDKDDPNIHNKVMKAPLPDLLRYGAMDSLTTYWWYKKQLAFFNRNPLLKKGNQFFIEGSKLFTEMELNGIPTDKHYFIEADKTIGQEIVELEKQIREDKDVIRWQESVMRGFKPGSPVDLAHFFYVFLSLPVNSVTDKGKPSVDIKALRGIEHPIARIILKLRKLEKIKGTYISQFLTGITEEGKIHPFYNLHRVLTYRSSSSAPNFQNIPVRDPSAKEITRSGIKPSPGNIILDFDFSSAEVRVLACYCKDPILMAYIHNPQTDMHRDQACDIFFLEPHQITKELRFHTKNGFVFPEIYGSFYLGCASSIWPECKDMIIPDLGITVMEHLVNSNIVSRRKPFDSFAEHMKKVEKAFWEKFARTREWQYESIDKFKQTGTLDLFHSFQIQGYIKKNKLFNYRIQGTAFHLLLETLILLNNYMKSKTMLSRIIGQIHDCGLIDCYPEEKDIIVEAVEDIVSGHLPERNEWMCVPFTVEWEATEVNGSWYKKESFEYDDNEEEEEE